MKDEEYMRIAIEEAKKGDHPFGCVIVKDNQIVIRVHNTAAGVDPTAHAEMNAIREACKKLGTKDLSGCTLFTTCEPCAMCFIAAWWAKISKIVYGMGEKDISEEEWKIDVSCVYLNSKSGNKIELKGGILRDECLRLFK